MRNRVQGFIGASLAGLLALPLGCSDSGSSAAGGSGGGSNTKSKVEVTISGEDLATDGFSFPQGSEVLIADGWEITFSHVLVTVGNITLSDNPDMAPSDQSQTGPVVQSAAGPWAVDLHEPGTVPGAGGEGTATPITTLEGDFEPDQRYAFGYDVITATDQATRLNFAGKAEAEDAYQEMIAKGYTVLFVGTATFKGQSCDVSDPAYDFSALPKTVSFRLGFSAPTSFINCQNQDNQGDAFADEEYQRGVAIPTNAPGKAQMTLHLDHAFYSSLVHEPALFFDQMAARLVGKPDTAVLTLDDLKGVDPTAFTDANGAALPWRVCDGSMLPMTKQRGFETGSVPVDPAGMPDKALRDYADFVHYVVSAQGHLNGGEGLCYVKRNYPSPQ